MATDETGGGKTVELSRGEAVSEAIRLLFEVETVAGMSDGQLLDRFLARRSDEEAAKVAFAALVERHGPMVLRACRARLGDEHDAQDAFQATFLILARKAGAIRKQESAASWLHGVARRVASCARRAASVRRAKERKAAGGKVEIVADADRSDLVPAVHEEVGDLPEKYRAPLLLCLLDGLTHEEAATHLGWPVGTVKTRVRRAKDQLRVRLTRRGLAPSLGAIGAALAVQEASAMPATLVWATAQAALGTLQPGSIAVASTVSALVELGLRSLIMTQLKVAALVVASFGSLATVASALAPQGSAPQENASPVEARKPSLEEATQKPSPEGATQKPSSEEALPKPSSEEALQKPIPKEAIFNNSDWDFTLEGGQKGGVRIREGRVYPGDKRLTNQVGSFDFNGDAMYFEFVNHPKISHAEAKLVKVGEGKWEGVVVDQGGGERRIVMTRAR